MKSFLGLCTINISSALTIVALRSVLQFDFRGETVLYVLNRISVGFVIEFRLIRINQPSLLAVDFSRHDEEQFLLLAVYLFFEVSEELVILPS